MIYLSNVYNCNSWNIEPSWTSHLYRPHATSLITWKLFHNVIATKDILIWMRMHMFSSCSISLFVIMTWKLRTTHFLNAFMLYFSNIWWKDCLARTLIRTNCKSLFKLLVKIWAHNLIMILIVLIFWKTWHTRNNFRL